MSTSSAGRLKCLSKITGNFERSIQGSHGHKDLEISGNYRTVISRPRKIGTGNDYNHGKVMNSCAVNIYSHAHINGILLVTNSLFVKLFQQIFIFFKNHNWLEKQTFL